MVSDQEEVVSDSGVTVESVLLELLLPVYIVLIAACRSDSAAGS